MTSFNLNKPEWPRLNFSKIEYKYLMAFYIQQISEFRCIVELNDTIFFCDLKF